MKKITIKLSLLLHVITIVCSHSTQAQYVDIPNPTFKSRVLSQVPHPTSPANITPAEAAAYTGALSATADNITDLTGINAFTHITNLNCSANSLTTLNVSGCTSLNTLSCTNNALTSLIVTGCSALNAIYCYNNSLTSLNVSSNSQLGYLICQNNEITSLDLSNNPLLSNFECYNNSLNNLNIRNGNNGIISIFDATSNPSLTCIKVDNVINANSYQYWFKDTIANYNTSCGLSSKDFNNQSTLVQYYPNPFSNSFKINLRYLQTANVQINVLDMFGRTIETKNFNNTEVIDLGTNYSCGIYNLEVKRGDKSELIRVVKR